jgi:hypothetical protein
MTWTTQISSFNDNHPLMECSPALICQFDNLHNAEFRAMNWGLSARSPGSMTVKADQLECWIYGPQASRSMEIRILKTYKETRREEFMQMLFANDAEGLKSLLEQLLVASNSFSFPTIQLEITSPMEGLVPFALKAVRLKIGGEISAAERGENAVHVPVAQPGHDTRRICFQRLWDVLYDPTRCDHRTAVSMRNLVRTAMQL